MVGTVTLAMECEYRFVQEGSLLAHTWPYEVQTLGTTMEDSLATTSAGLSSAESHLARALLDGHHHRKLRKPCAVPFV